MGSQNEARKTRAIMKATKLQATIEQHSMFVTSKKIPLKQTASVLLYESTEHGTDLILRIKAMGFAPCTS